MTTFPWTIPKETAARLLAHGEMTIGQIAKRLGVSRDTIFNWKHHPEFAQRVNEHVRDFSEALKEITIEESVSRAKARLEWLQKIHKVLQEMTEDDLRVILDSPISALNLMLRFHSAVEQFERRQTLEYGEHDDELPPGWDRDPAISARIVALIEAKRKERDCDGGIPPADLS